MAANFLQEGLKLMLETFFQNSASAPASFKVGLASAVTAPITAGNGTLTDLTELSGNTYARQLLARAASALPTTPGFTSSNQSTNAAQVAADAVIFENTSLVTWTEAVGAFLCTVEGKLIAYLPLSTGRTLLAGDSLTVTITGLKLTEGV